MKFMIRWAVHNGPAMNTLLVAVLSIGAASLWFMRREVFPEFELEVILASVPYPGASPEEVEEGICYKLEEAVRSINHIKRQISIANEGVGHLILELESDVPDVQKVLNEVRSEIDRIPSFPELTEDPEVKQITLRTPAIMVAVVGPQETGPTLESELQLRDVTERVRSELLLMPAISHANIIGEKQYQIDIEVPQARLREYGLTLRGVAHHVRQQNLEIPGGNMKTDSQEVLLRVKDKRLIGDQIRDITVATSAEGARVTLDDLGNVRDGFIDNTSISQVNGHPGLVVSVNRAVGEDLLGMTTAVKDYVDKADVPPGYKLYTWNDRSIDVRDRMELLSRNGLQGLLLVFLVLAIFLQMRLAFWVALGIPIAVLGASGILLYADQTLNMLTMFAFLMALGIVVDDAIVIGENIHSYRQRGDDHVSAAINGTWEVLPAVVASVSTTIIAFCPMFFVAGIMGKFIAVLPLAVISMLIISLIESTFILPCHLAHDRGLLFIILEYILFPLRPVGQLFSWLNEQSGRLTQWTIDRAYLPLLRWSLANPLIAVSSSVTILLVSLGLVTAGFTPWVVFPKVDSNVIEAKVVYPDGTPAAITDRATQRLEQAIEEVARLSEDKSLILLTHRAVGLLNAQGVQDPDSRAIGSHVGVVTVELVDTSRRDITSQQIVAKWRKSAGDFSGVERLTFQSSVFGPGGRPIEFKLLCPSDRVEELEAAVEKCKQQLSSYEGVEDIADDANPGKWEFQMKVKPQAESMGITLADLAQTVRASYYGEEVMRLQRGRHEVKLMVRYPENERRSLANFEEIRVHTREGEEVPLMELADIRVHRGYSEINRVNQQRSITITADVDEARGNANKFVTDLRRKIEQKDGLLADFPSVTVLWEGQKQQSTESMTSLMKGFGVALLAMYVLLTVEFRSYLQPLIILLIIPFGIIGALWGHMLLGLELTLFSVFGMVALTGVVINGSIVLVDFINRQLGTGMHLSEVLIEAGRRRFRPVVLTSMTTMAGLLPILTETSFQAQILIPMATSLCFGLLTGTILILVLIPTFFSIYAWILRYAYLPLMSGDAPSTQPRSDQTALPVGAESQVQTTTGDSGVVRDW